jgi:hypothetical protein
MKGIQASIGPCMLERESPIQRQGLRERHCPFRRGALQAAPKSPVSGSSKGERQGKCLVPDYVDQKQVNQACQRIWYELVRERQNRSWLRILGCSWGPRGWLAF